MKQIRLLACAVVSLLALAGPLNARVFKVWSNQELTDKSDLVVIATPASTATTEEKLVLAGQPVAGVETKFTVLAVLKGDPATRNVVLLHYKADGGGVPNGPNLVSFDPAKNQQFLLFLVRQSDGRYAPTSGQIDPAYKGGIYSLTAP